MTVNDSIISGNSAGDGGGIYNVNNGGGALLEFRNAILKAGGSGENILCRRHRLLPTDTTSAATTAVASLTGPGDQINTDPFSAPSRTTADQPSRTSCCPGSPAIDAGDPSFTPPPFYDQRGLGF